MLLFAPGPQASRAERAACAASCRTGLLVALLASLLGGCDQLQVEPFRGSWISLAMTWPFLQPSPMGPPPSLLPDGEHLDLWAQLGDGRVVRLLADEHSEQATFPGFDVRLALVPDDPCLVRALDPDDEACLGKDSAECGAHLLYVESKPPEQMTEQDLRQQAIVQHARQVISQATPITAAGGVRGKVTAPLLVLTQYDPGGRADAPMLQLTAQNAGPSEGAPARAAACRGFAARHPNYYLGNPRQLTKPLHGALYGFFNFSTTPTPMMPDLPSQSFGSIVVTTGMPLPDLKALFFTRESAPTPAAPSPDPTRRVVTGVVLPPGSGGRGVTRLALAAVLPIGPMGAPMTVTVGTASVITGLDQGLTE